MQCNNSDMRSQSQIIIEIFLKQLQLAIMIVACMVKLKHTIPYIIILFLVFCDNDRFLGQQSEFWKQSTKSSQTFECKDKLVRELITEYGTIQSCDIYLDFSIISQNHHYLNIHVHCSVTFCIRLNNCACASLYPLLIMSFAYCVNYRMSVADLSPKLQLESLD